MDKIPYGCRERTRTASQLFRPGWSTIFLQLAEASTSPRAQPAMDSSVNAHLVWQRTQANRNRRREDRIDHSVMESRERYLRLAVRQAKPANHQDVVMHRVMTRTRNIMHEASASSSSVSSQDTIASGVQLAELVSAVKRDDEIKCSHWASLAAQHDVLDQRSERHRSGGAFLVSAPPLWLAVYNADLQLTLQFLRGGADP